MEYRMNIIFECGERIWQLDANPNIYKCRKFWESMVLDTSNTTSKYGINLLLLLFTITIEKTVELKQC